MAEAYQPALRTTTVFILMFGVGSVLIDLGRPIGCSMHPICSFYFSFTVGRLQHHDVPHGEFHLPLSRLDSGYCSAQGSGGRREWFYRILSFGYTGAEAQHRRLDKAIGAMSILVIPVMITVHTVVSFVFAMTIQPLWHSAIFGPYFVVGAIFSGVASVIVVMAILRKAYHLESYIKPIHFNNIGIFLMAMTLLWFYFTFAENITIVYGNEPVHMAIFWSKISGKFAPLFWLHFTMCFVIPLPILAIRKYRTIRGTVIASISIVLGMWLERFVIIVPTLTRQRLPVEQAFYIPTWVEWSILAGCISLFMLLYTLFTKVFPIVPIWEIREGREKAVAAVSERIKSYLPEQDTLDK